MGATNMRRNAVRPAGERLTAEACRGSIITAAVRLFSENGFRAVTTRKLAADVATSEPVLPMAHPPSDVSPHQPQEPACPRLQEETITTPFDMGVLNEMDRLHLAMGVIDRLPQLGARSAYLKQELRET